MALFRPSCAKSYFFSSLLFHPPSLFLPPLSWKERLNLYNIIPRHHPRPLTHTHLHSSPAVPALSLSLVHQRHYPLLMIYPAIPLVLLSLLLLLLSLPLCLVLSQTAEVAKQRPKPFPSQAYASSPSPWSSGKIYIPRFCIMTLPRSLIYSVSIVSSVEKSSRFCTDHP